MIKQSKLLALLMTVAILTTSVLGLVVGKAGAATSNQLTSDEQKMVNLVNQERAKRGLPALQVNMKLVQIARAHAKEMISRGYFSHNSPVTGSPFDRMRAAGIKYSYAGENLAGNQTVQRAHTALMNSAGHRANILNKNYNQIGIGIVNGGRYGKMFVQEFIKSSVKATAPAPTTTQTPSPTPKPTPTPQPTTNPAPTPAPTTNPAPTAGLTAQEQQMLNLVNQERAANGLSPLKANMKLVQIARSHAKEMIDRGYFDHNSPVTGSPFDRMRSVGVSYGTAGENIAGNSSVQAAHTALMNSPGHRANILNPGFTEVGIGIVSGGSYGMMFVQDFIG